MYVHVCVLVLERDGIKDATTQGGLRDGVSSEEWNRKCGAGDSGLEDCWQTGAERSLSRTSWEEQEEDVSPSGSHTLETQ